MDYKIKLDSFEGPLDLLLHLIERQELDIHDIPIARVTEQYLDYLWAMKQLDLDIASEFLVMGATLLSIKAKMLLPRPPIQSDEEEIVDPREELVVRLLEYQKYKGVMEELRARELAQRQLYTHSFDFQGLIAGIEPPNPLENVSPWDLLNTYQKLLATVSASQPVRQLKRDEFTVGEELSRIRQLLIKSPEGVEFKDLLMAKPSPAKLVVNFLALLELLRLGQVNVFQKTIYGPIYIKPVLPVSTNGGSKNDVC